MNINPTKRSFGILCSAIAIFFALVLSSCSSSQSSSGASKKKAFCGSINSLYLSSGSLPITIAGDSFSKTNSVVEASAKVLSQSSDLASSAAINAPTSSITNALTNYATSAKLVSSNKSLVLDLVGGQIPFLFTKNGKQFNTVSMKLSSVWPQIEVSCPTNLKVNSSTTTINDLAVNAASLGAGRAMSPVESPSTGRLPQNKNAPLTKRALEEGAMVSVLPTGKQVSLVKIMESSGTNPISAQYSVNLYGIGSMVCVYLGPPPYNEIHIIKCPSS